MTATTDASLTGTLDVAIIGAGPLGLATALALQTAGRSPTLIDARAADAPLRDARVLALSHGSRMLLEKLGAWPAAQATPITRIHVSQRGALGRTLMQADDYGLPALGYVLPAQALVETLLHACGQRGIAIRHGIAVQDVEANEDQVLLLGEADAQDAIGSAPVSAPVCAKLALSCEGAVDKDAGRSFERDYDQHALLCRVRPLVPHNGQAWERFTPDGPIALLPLGQDYSVVWTLPGARVDALYALDDDALREALQAAFGPAVRLGAVSERARYPLGLRVRRDAVGKRMAWLGNAAQTLHPVAGQGFNLALRDAWELADTLRGATDPGDPALLTRYARGRLLDRAGTIGFTDSLVRIFSTPNPLLTHARGAALLALDILPPLRHFVAKRMLFGARAWP
ncbi:MAG: FAD-dependent monooxygenase [Moraxellaceae bacterium]|nr:FAD-dependent monooxygenase [Moraxellaceae bacterium]